VPLRIIQFRIVKPTRDDKILIKNDADGNPKMQTLTARVELQGTGINQQTINNQRVCWKFKVEYKVNTNVEKRARKGLEPGGGGNGTDGYLIPAYPLPPAPGQVECIDRTGPEFVIDESGANGAKWDANFGGGILTVTAKTSLPGVELSDTITQRIEGETFSDAFKSTVTAYLDSAPTDTADPVTGKTIRQDVGYNTFFRVIAYKETGYRHYYPSIFGQPKSARYPRENSEGDGGFGIMQVTEDASLPLNHLPSYVQIWNCQKNVDGGVEVVRGKVAEAKAYPTFVRTAGCSRPPVVINGRTKYYCFPMQDKDADATDFNTPYLLRMDTYSLWNSGWHYWKWTLVNLKTGREDWRPRHPQGEAPEGTGSYYADDAEEIENNPPDDF
jgi:hypothetical protein